MGDVQIIIHPSEDGRQLFWAESPQYPGCYTDGRTIDELLRNWQEASALWLEDADVAQREYLAPYYGKRRTANRTSAAGSHHKYRKPGCRNIVIPFHGSSDLAPGLQQSIMREAGITRAEIERRTP